MPWWQRLHLFAELAPTLLARLNGKLLDAHNARFDYGFLKNELSAGWV